MNTEPHFETAKALPDDKLLEYINDIASKLIDKKAAATLRPMLTSTGIFDPGSDLQVIRLGVILAITADIATIPYFERRSRELVRMEALGASLGIDPKWIHRGVIAADEIQQVLESSLTS